MTETAIRKSAEPTNGEAGTTPSLQLGSQHDIRARRPSLLRTLIGRDNWRRVLRVATLVSLDFIGVYLAIYSAVAVKTLVRDALINGRVAHTTLTFFVFAFLITLLLFARNGLYGPRESRPGLSKVISALLQVAAVSLLFSLAEGHRISSYFLFFGSLFFAAIYVSALRSLFEWVSGRILRASGYRRRAVLVGSGEQIDAVAKALRDADSNYEITGFISLSPRPENGLRDLGPLSALPGLLAHDTIQEVIIADPAFPEEQAVELVDECHRSGVAVRVAPSTMELLARRVELVPGHGVPLLELQPPVFEGLDYVVKRSFDIIGAILIAIVLSPILALIAALVKLTSRGPVLYKSVRPGIGGRTFDCLKFRTMVVDAESRQAELEDKNEASGAMFKIRKDPRLTPIGGFLRRFSLDELPQLVNVLRGEMSLVGPRPLPLRDYEHLADWHKRRYLVLPGITGLWQVSGRADLDFDELVRLDFVYLERWSVLLDLAILLRTVPAVLRRRGAY